MKAASFRKSGCRILIATWRRNCGSKAFQTSAIPPRPRSSCNSYLPMRCGFVFMVYPFASRGQLHAKRGFEQQHHYQIQGNFCQLIASQSLCDINDKKRCNYSTYLEAVQQTSDN